MSIHYHNNFKLTLRDASTGVIKQEAEAYNVVCYRMYASSGNRSNSLKSISLGTGTGTPAYEDSALFQYLYGKAAELVPDYAYPVTTYTITATFEASEAIGLLTEIGLGNYNNALTTIMTHAMLQDIEGNPITIEKTNLDILEVVATFYVDFTSIDPRLEMVKSPSTNVLLTSLASSFNPAARFAQYVYASISRYATSRITEVHGEGSSIGKLIYGSDGRLFSLPANSVVDSNESNNMYINSLMLSDMSIPTVAGVNQLLGFIPLPNPAVFPEYRTAKTLVGRGDAVTTQFNHPIPRFLEDTEEVYVNDVLQVRGVDYTADCNNNNLQWMSASDTMYIPCDITIEMYPDSYTTSYTLTPLGFSTSLVGIPDKQEAPEYAEGAFKTEYLYEFSQPAMFDRWVVQNLYTTYNYSISSGTIHIDYFDEGTNTWVNILQMDKVLGSSGTVISPEQKILFGRTIIASKVRFMYFYIPSASTPDTAVPGAIHGATNAVLSGLSYEGAKLTFTNPPPADALITMTAIVDRPFKTSDYVIDVNLSLAY